MNKWEALAAILAVIAVCGMIAALSYNVERTKQYRIQYNCNE